jgi:lysophospholipase L1-like esterase
MVKEMFLTCLAHLRTIRLRSTVALLLVVFAISRCRSQFRPPQVSISDQDTVGYSFLMQDSNLIKNRALLRPVFEQLYQQRLNGGERITIVHIGDSHTQGNFMTHEVRLRLQDAFGNAGRGLIFPYRLAGTYGPRDFLVETNCSWRGSSCQRDLDETTPYGVSGFLLETDKSEGRLTIRMRDTATATTNPFTKATVFYRKTPETFDLEIVDDLTNQKSRRLIEDDFSSTYFFDRPVAQLTLQYKKQSDAQKRLVLDGISLENELSGVIYHSIGVSGGKYLDFARAQYFARHVGYLQPDLIVISLGTNEAQGTAGPKGLYSQMKELVSQLQQQSPGTPILLTTPADSYLRGRGFNPYMEQISAIICRFAEDNNLALWDLYGISGGAQSAQKWKSNGLMSKDSVHYSKTGYAVQGKLFYLSLINSYNRYVEGMTEGGK